MTQAKLVVAFKGTLCNTSRAVVVGHRKQVNGGTQVTGYYGYFRRFFAQFLSNYNRCLEAVGTPTLEYDTAPRCCGHPATLPLGC